jgi:hypothetical protein
MTECASMVRTLDLPGGSLVPFASAPGERVRVVYGSVWVTEEGNPSDAFLASGQEISLQSRGLAVIEALGPARIQLCREARAPYPLLRAAGTAARRLAEWIARVALRPTAARGTV